MSQFRVVTAALTLLLSLSTPTQASAADDQRAGTQTVLFVCEHGSVKSLLAKLLFDRVAEGEDLAVHAASRGTVPDAEVPEWMRTALERDGFHIGSWRPTALSEADVRTAHRVVAFDVTLPSDGEVKFERWDGLPALSKDYAAGREAMAARIKQLVVELKRSEEAPALND